MLACSASMGAADTLTLHGLFPSDRVLDVQITLSKEDWNSRRYQTRDRNSLGNRRLKPLESPFSYFKGHVTIDGVEFPDVGVRKKGFLGSLSSSRPSLKIKLNFFDRSADLGGLKTLTFNNNQQDRALLSQYMSYAVFNDAGSPGSRWAFASVTVNGKHLGVYSHVESVKQPLLQREFGTDKGTLYEGTAVDFDPGWENSFERKMGDDGPGRRKIRQIIEALQGDPGNPITSTDAEIRAWAATSAKHDRKWMTSGFNDSGWKVGRNGAGYERDRGYESFIHSSFNFEDQLFNRTASIYLRIPFAIENLASLKESGQLTLRVRYDDGFVAYLNGERVASANTPERPRWDSLATDNHDDSAATAFQPFYISDYAGRLRQGRNVLAIQGLNISRESTDMLSEAALRSESNTLEQTIAEHVDLDSFYKFWAIEGLLGFWDGYSGNRNNFFFYHNPKTGKIHFIPWGADALFTNESWVRSTVGLPRSVKTRGVIANRLWSYKNVRKRYARTMKGLLDNHWDAEKLLTETHRLEAMLKPHVAPSQKRFQRSLNEMRRFINGRRTEVMAEIKENLPPGS
ncbi:MAG TPA: hypothetical protein EYQ50_29905 [Verrucomicrobiales bacterium]|nr:hypothetical protein [Verrucomicrobiales bacterium]